MIQLPAILIQLLMCKPRKQNETWITSGSVAEPEVSIINQQHTSTYDQNFFSPKSYCILFFDTVRLAEFRSKVWARAQDFRIRPRPRPSPGLGAWAQAWAQAWVQSLSPGLGHPPHVWLPIAEPNVAFLEFENGPFRNQKKSILVIGVL